MENESNKPKHSEEILNEQINTALKEHKRPTLGLFLSAFSAGLEISFSFFLIAIVHYLFVDQMNEDSLKMAMAFCYPIGFVLVIIGRSELFTEHTTLAVLPVFEGLASIWSLLVLWTTIFFGNVLGGYVFSFLLIEIGKDLGITDKESIETLAKHVIDYPTYVMLFSGVMAGWLMGLLAWLITAANETISRIVIIILITTLIGIGGLHHSIVGSTEVFSGMLVSDKITWKDYLNFQWAVTLGNIIGGVFFVSLIKYGHTKNAR
ncbi:MAG: formate/nitrite transporter family protein [Thermonemataceae bacterium]